MARRSAGVSGTAVLFGAAGIYLAYAGVKNVPLVSGLRSLLRGQRPTEGSGTPYKGPAAAVAAAGPADAGVSSTDSAAFAAGSLPVHSVSQDQTTVVAGIRVHKLIAENVRSMVAAAARSNVTLTGSGWRSTSAQAALRLANGCPDIYNSPSSSCRIPTAIPGHSMHERGLAIDFSRHGRSIRRDDPEFRWLAGNAARFGFKNLPSEPWHWSTNGS